MIQYRSFLNSDTPSVAGIWSGRDAQRGALQSVSALLLEEQVYAKLYFDRAGLIVAVEDGRFVGFVHAGFLPNADRSALSSQQGVINLLMVVPDTDRQAIGSELMRRAEAYLLGRGATSVFAGSPEPWGPFYLGLYGGSQLPGVLASDKCWNDVLESSGYVEAEQHLILQRGLSGFRPPVDRQMMQIRRQCQWEVERDPIACSWWEACTTGEVPRTRFLLSSKTNANLKAAATFWNVEPFASQWGTHAMGLLGMESTEEARQQGWELFLLAESLRKFQQDGISLVEVQMRSSETAKLELMKKLGFQEIDRGTVFKKGS